MALKRFITCRSRVRSSEDVLAKLQRGVHLAEGFAHVKHVRIKSRRKRSTILEMVLDEGRNREVRRLLARVGHKVQRLKRIAVGPVRLADLPTGAVRPLTKKEIQSLEKAVIAAAEPKDDSRQKPSRVQQIAKMQPKKATESTEVKERRADGDFGWLVISS